MGKTQEMVRVARVRTLDRQGRVDIPAPWLRILGIGDGDQVLLRFDQEEKKIVVQPLVLTEIV